MTLPPLAAPALLVSSVPGRRSVDRSVRRRLSESEQDSQPLYSQALLQAHPGSPASPRAAAVAATAAAVARGATRQSALPTSREKENVSPLGGDSAAAVAAARPVRRGDGEGSVAGGSRQGAGAAARPPPGLQGAGPGAGARADCGRTAPLTTGGSSSAARPAAARPVARDGRQAFVDRRPSAANSAVANSGAAFSGSQGVPGRGAVGATAGGSVAAAGRGQGGNSGVASSQGGASQGGGASLTEQQRQKMLENRAKALARRKEKQAAAAAAAAAAGVTAAGAAVGTRKAGVGAVTGNVGERVGAGGGNSGGSGGGPGAASARPPCSVHQAGPPGCPPWSQQQLQATQSSNQQRGRFRLMMDMDSGGEDDSDAEVGGASASAAAAAAAPSPAGAPGSSAFNGNKERAVLGRDENGGAGAKPAANAPQPKQPAACRCPPRPPPAAHAVAAATAAAPPSSSRSAATTTTAPAAVIVPLSAPRATALEPLARELRSRPGVAVHASPLGGEPGRYVDLVVGAQCAVCVRTRKQFLSQTRSPPLPSPPPPDLRPGERQPPLTPATPPLVGLLQASLQRYARVVVVVEGLEDGQSGVGGGGGGGGEHLCREAVARVEALRGASVVASRGWRNAADRVEALVRRETSDGLGMAQEVRERADVFPLPLNPCFLGGVVERLGRAQDRERNPPCGGRLHVCFGINLYLEATPATRANMPAPCRFYVPIKFNFFRDADDLRLCFSAAHGSKRCGQSLISW